MTRIEDNSAYRGRFVALSHPQRINQLVLRLIVVSLFTDTGIFFTSFLKNQELQTPFP